MLATALYEPPVDYKTRTSFDLMRVIEDQVGITYYSVSLLAAPVLGARTGWGISSPEFSRDVLVGVWWA